MGQSRKALVAECDRLKQRVRELESDAEWRGALLQRLRRWIFELGLEHRHHLECLRCLEFIKKEGRNG